MLNHDINYNKVEDDVVATLNIIGGRQIRIRKNAEPTRFERDQLKTEQRFDIGSALLHIVADSIQESQDFFEENRAVMTTDRIDYLIEDSGAGTRKNYAQSWITSISPTDFLNMTLSEKGQDRDNFDKMPGDYGSTVNDYNYIDGLKNEKRQTPYLAIDVSTGEVVGHEGRHRMRALEKAGVTSSEIRIEFRDENGRLIKEKNKAKLNDMKKFVKLH